MKEYEYLDELISRYPVLAPVKADIRTAYETLKECYERGGKLLIAGNGGSCADSEHIVGELMKEFDCKRPVDAQTAARLREQGEAAQPLLALQGAIPAISLDAHSALISAIANDMDAAMVYAQQVYGYARPGDVLIGLSTSGNSKNVVNAVRLAKATDVVTICITGKTGGALAALADVTICLPETETYKVQELTLPVYHMLCHEVERAVFS